MHSVFGSPSDNQELFAAGARAMAAAWLTPLPSVLLQNGAPKEILEAVMTSLWKEFAQPCLEGSASPEGKLFWKSLDKINDSLCSEASEILSNNLKCKLNYDRTKTETLQASRCFLFEQS